MTRSIFAVLRFKYNKINMMDFILDINDGCTNAVYQFWMPLLNINVEYQY